MNIIKKYEISTFYVCVYVTTGILFFVQALLFPELRLPLYLLAPAFFALVMTLVTSKKEGLLSFIKNLVPKNMKIKWLLISAIVPCVLIFLSDIVFNITTGNTFDYRSSVIPFDVGYVLVFWIGSLGEEIGWRAYLLPKMTSRYSKLISSLIVGFLWVLWHAGDYGQGVGYIIQIIWMLAMSIIMTWLYYKSNKNLLTAVIYHAIFGISGTYVGIVMPLPISYHLALTAVFGTYAILLVIMSDVFKRDFKE